LDFKISLKKLKKNLKIWTIYLFVLSFN